MAEMSVHSGRLELALHAEQRLELLVELGQLLRGEAADGRAILVEEEDAREIPADLSGKRRLGHLPHGLRLGPVDPHLGHQMTAAAIGRQALALDEGGDLRLRELLPAELVAGEEQDVDRLAMLPVPRLQLLVDGRGRTSAARNIEHDDGLAGERVHGQRAASDGLAGERVERGGHDGASGERDTGGEREPAGAHTQHARRTKRMRR